MKSSQTQSVLALLRQRGVSGVTQLEALSEVGTMRLASRINDLRKTGHQITTHLQTTPGGARIARYVLEETTQAKE